MLGRRTKEKPELVGIFTLGAIQLLIVLLANASTPERRIEQSLAGLTAGVSAFAEARARFGSRIFIKHGSHIVRFDPGCELQIGPDDQMNMSGTGRITILSAQQADGKQHTNPARCSDLATGMGLHLGATLDEVKRIYGEPTSEGPFGDDSYALAFENSGKCQNPAVRTLQRKSLAIWLSNETKRVTEITIEIDKVSCEELREEWKLDEKYKKGGRVARA
jgi:hypothetical protein